MPAPNVDLILFPLKDLVDKFIAQTHHRITSQIKAITAQKLALESELAEANRFDSLQLVLDGGNVALIAQNAARINEINAVLLPVDKALSILNQERSASTKPLNELMQSIRNLSFVLLQAKQTILNFDGEPPVFELQTYRANLGSLKNKLQSLASHIGCAEELNLITNELEVIDRPSSMTEVLA